MRSYKLILFIIVSAACLTQFSSDIYAPSLPSIASFFNTSIHLVQASMAIYMLGVALSQLIYGPISEAFGRKNTLAIGISIMLIGSLICMVSPTIYVLIMGRFIQGCGAGACASLWRSVFRDVFTSEELAKYASYLIVFVMFIVPAAPTLGGYLQHYFDWRAIFVFLCIYTLVSLLSIIYGFKETSTHFHKDKLKWSYILKTYQKLLSSRIFMGVTFCTFISYGATFAWFVSGPVLFIQVIGISPVSFGWISFLGAGSAYALAGWLNGKVVTRFGMGTMMRVGWGIMVVSGLIMLLSSYFIELNIWSLSIPFILFFFGSTFIWPNAFATAFTPFGDIAGYAGALYGFMQICGAATIGGIMSYLPNTTQVPLNIVILISSVFSWIFYEMVVSNKVVES